MKLKKSAFIFFFSISLSLFSQETIEFSNEFKPESEYVITTKTETKSTVSFEASEDFLNHLKTKGIENPQTTNESSTMKIAYNTGSEKKGTMPIEIKYIETGMPQDGFIRNGESLKGTYNSKGVITITELPDESRIGMQADQVMVMMSEWFSVDLFDHGKLSIGDIVNIRTPMTFPLGSYQISMDMINTYKLMRVKSGKAIFTISSSCALLSDYPELNLSATADGSGTCTYDVKKKKIISKTTELTMKMSGELQNNVKMNIFQHTISSETAKIK